jgi:xanthine dehydrogenase accessory factor
VVETHREAGMGRVLEKGEALPSTGIPGPIRGETAGRLLRSPAAGRLVPCREIGDLVAAGETVGHVEGKPLKSKLNGMLRGLIHHSVELSTGDKVGDIDPRGDAVDPRRVSDKALAVAGGVLEALLRSGVLPRLSV